MYNDRYNMYTILCKFSTFFSCCFQKYLFFSEIVNLFYHKLF